MSLRDAIKKNMRTKSEVERELIKNQKEQFDRKIIRNIGKPLCVLLNNDIICRSYNGEINGGEICGTISYDGPVFPWPSNWERLQGIEIGGYTDGGTPIAPHASMYTRLYTCVSKTHTCLKLVWGGVSAQNRSSIRCKNGI